MHVLSIVSNAIINITNTILEVYTDTLCNRILLLKTDWIKVIIIKQGVNSNRAGVSTLEGIT